MATARRGDREPAARIVNVDELAEHAHEIVHEIGETGRPIDIALKGEIVATLSPVGPDDVAANDDRRIATRAWLRETETFAQEVARRWPSGRTSVDLIREQRRDL